MDKQESKFLNFETLFWLLFQAFFSYVGASKGHQTRDVKLNDCNVL